MSGRNRDNSRELLTGNNFRQSLESKGQIDVPRDLPTPFQDRGEVRGGQVIDNILVRRIRLRRNGVDVIIDGSTSGNHDIVCLHSCIRQENVPLECELRTIVDQSRHISANGM